MGMGIGIAIGWPASSVTTEPDTYFLIAEYCNGKPADGNTTQFVSSTVYDTGDYVYAEGQLSRVLLGNKVRDAGAIESISGPVYNSCG